MSTVLRCAVRALAVVSAVWTAGCLPAIPVGLIASVSARNAPAAYYVTPDSLRAGEVIRLWTAPGAQGDFVAARFDSIREASVHFTRKSDAKADSVALGAVTRLDVTRGTRKSPTRAFWMPVVGGTVGPFAGVLASCMGSESNLCGLPGILFGGLSGMIFGTWYGLRPVPRWVAVDLHLP